MNAIYIEQYGPIDGLRIREIQKPKIGAGNVLVKVEAAGINPSDLLSFQGKFPGAGSPSNCGSRSCRADRGRAQITKTLCSRLHLKAI